MKERSADPQKTNDALLAEIGERQRVEEALRASEQRLQDYIVVASDWYWETDKNLRFAHVGAEGGAAAVGTRSGIMTLAALCFALWAASIVTFRRAQRAWRSFPSR